ncbi:S-adenosyl-L-methionine-dependent methyltransferase [Triangularia verruculosa]|uniref:peptide chain release factor N(5)-glutamine methyltransferase n=1 Tax=Triangularia verruculosa TaxID=2587418 RepID=A0AAN7AWD2_9PEZI|nr:S-adenosyl-L-methionine-dependent methyltransferase [Triangularia verruculosa]
MPRLPPSLFWRARKQISPFAPLLLPVCRTLDSTANELRWIKQHVNSTKSLVPRRLRIWQACLKRGDRGMPLQYVLGTQPFGPLEILCRPGVLIPRPETESLIYHLHSILPRHSSQPLKILDLCTGTGCIPLLLSSLLPASTKISGVDISPQAISLSRENLTHNITLSHLPASASKSINFTKADIFSPGFVPSLGYKPGELDILVSNPPYISSHGFNTTTERSVRLFEPKLALVPQVTAEQYDCEPEDVFYARLLEIISVLQPKRVLFEVGDLDQAARVAAMVVRGKGALEVYAQAVEIWRDEPGVDSHEEGVTEKMGVDEEAEVEIKGQGNGRGVYFWRRDDQESE